MKRIITLMVTVALIMTALSACGAKQEEAATQAAAAPAADQTVYELVFAHGNSPETPHHLAAETFKEYVEKESNGRIKVSLFHSNSLGTAQECFEACQNGSMAMTFVPTARLSGYVPELQLFDLPFLFPSTQAKYDILDGEIGKKLLENVAAQQVIPVGFYDDGNKQMTADRELTSLDSFKGIKFRTMESDVIMEQYRLLGAEPIAIEYSELYNALQMKVANAQENPLMQIYTNNYYEVQDYLMLTNHASLSGVLMISEKWYNDLPADLQEIVMKAANDWIKNERQGIADKEAGWLESIKAAGTNVIELPAETLEIFKETTAPTYDIFREKYGAEILDQIIEAVK